MFPPMDFIKGRAEFFALRRQAHDLAARVEGRLRAADEPHPFELADEDRHGRLRAARELGQFVHRRFPLPEEQREDVAVRRHDAFQPRRGEFGGDPLVRGLVDAGNQHDCIALHGRKNKLDV